MIGTHLEAGEQVRWLHQCSRSHEVIRVSASAAASRNLGGGRSWPESGPGQQLEILVAKGTRIASPTHIDQNVMALESRLLNAERVAKAEIARDREAPRVKSDPLIS